MTQELPTESIVEAVRAQLVRTRAAARAIATASRSTKDRVLLSIAEALLACAPTLLEANRVDVQRAEANGTSGAMLDRLRLDEARIEGIARAVREIAALPDPVGRVDGLSARPNGMRVGRMQVPLGVVAMIYEARPNVTVDAAALCLKSGNACVLRGGSEARHSNEALAAVVREALATHGLPADAVSLLPSTSREATRALLEATGLVDVLVPRGGPGLVRFVAEHARVPVIAHYEGVCHLFIDEGADLARAVALTVDGKARRPGVCNALECLLVHRSEAERLLPRLAAALAEVGVEVRADERARAIVASWKPAAADDFGREFLDKILAIAVVDDLDSAMAHVAKYGSRHTESIVTPRYDHAERWLREVDASCVMVNASTRFNDGGELGLGAELGIATSKLHAYGPMGLDELTTKKWIVYGDGQARG